MSDGTQMEKAMTEGQRELPPGWSRENFDTLGYPAAAWRGDDNHPEEARNTVCIGAVPISCPCGRPDCRSPAARVMLTLVADDGSSIHTYLDSQRMMLLAEAYAHARDAAMLIAGIAKPRPEDIQ